MTTPALQITPSRKRAVLVIAALGTSFSLAASVMFVPAMPEMAKGLNTSIGMVQLAITTYLFGNAAGQPTMGALSDYFGRRRVLLSGLAMIIFASIGCALTDSIGVLLAMRLIQAVGTSAMITVSRAVVRDLFDRAQGARAMSLVMMAQSLGPIVAPLIGGYLIFFFDWRAIFWFSALSIGAMALWAWFAFPETNTTQHVPANMVRGMLSDFRLLITNRAFLSFSITYMLTFAAFWVFVATAPVLLIHVYGMPAQEYGLMVILSTIGFVLGSTLSNRLTVRVGLERMIMIGISMFMLGTSLVTVLSLLGVNPIVAVLGPMLIALTGQGLASPNFATGAISVMPRIAGTAAGLLGFLQIGGAGVGTFIVSRLEIGSTLDFGLVMIPFSALAIAGWLVLRTRPAKP